MTLLRPNYTINNSMTYPFLLIIMKRLGEQNTIKIIFLYIEYFTPLETFLHISVPQISFFSQEMNSTITLITFYSIH